MDNVARIFDQQNRGSTPSEPAAHGGGDAPWGLAKHEALPPMMLQLWLASGAMRAFAYSDIREVYCPDAGRIELSIQAMGRWVVALEGRRLGELAKRLTTGGVVWVRESDPRAVPRQESEPEIVRITIEELPD